MKALKNFIKKIVDDVKKIVKNLVKAVNRVTEFVEENADILTTGAICGVCTFVGSYVSSTISYRAGYARACVDYTKVLTNSFSKCKIFVGGIK